MTTGLVSGVLELDGQPLTLVQINQVAGGSIDAAIASGARRRIAASQAVVERIVASNETAYGINTGFGKMSDAVSYTHLDVYKRQMPCRPPDARRATREDSGWKTAEPMPINDAASKSRPKVGAIASSSRPSRVNNMPTGSE